jgi:hypothetical protein
MRSTASVRRLARLSTSEIIHSACGARKTLEPTYKLGRRAFVVPPSRGILRRFLLSSRLKAGLRTIYASAHYTTVAAKNTGPSVGRKSFAPTDLEFDPPRRWQHFRFSQSFDCCSAFSFARCRSRYGPGPGVEGMRGSAPRFSWRLRYVSGSRCIPDHLWSGQRAVAAQRNCRLWLDYGMSIPTKSLLPRP